MVREIACPSIPYLDRQDRHAFIQWKGTQACLDIYCECGGHYHLDAEMFQGYAVQCPRCQRKYELNPIIELIPQSEEGCEYHKPTLLDEDDE